MSQVQTGSGHARAIINYEKQSEKLSLGTESTSSKGTAVEAKFVTPLDPVIQTTDGGRLPVVTIDEAHKINLYRAKANGHPTQSTDRPTRARGLSRFDRPGPEKSQNQSREERRNEDGNLGDAIPPSRTHPLFPPLPLYGPPSLMRSLHCTAFRITSFIGSSCFLAVIVLGAAFISLPLMFNHIWLRLTFRDPDARRPFHVEEKKRKLKRREVEKAWVKNKKRRRSQSELSGEEAAQLERRYEPTEGGPDPLVCDVAYYARRVGLDIEEFKVQTEDGFVIALYHIYDRNEYMPANEKEREYSSPDVFEEPEKGRRSFVGKQFHDGQKRYPVLLMHGLLQSAGAYCTNDDDSLAFFLHKSGYDVWLGNNRCGIVPEHALLKYEDPRFWAWNIRQMGVMDLPALVSRVLEETDFGKIGLVCHSQGTTETFVALAKEQRPDLGEKLSVFCALAPAVYSGKLIDKFMLKIMRIFSPDLFRIVFGIHAFIPSMMLLHRILPGKLYGAMGYRVFAFLFDWNDDRWDRDLRDRMFQFAPVYVSAESMRWWLGRECFARQRCILATREEGRIEDVEDEGDEERRENAEANKESRYQTAWYNEQVPPIALWIAGSDELVDGRRLLRRLERGREPYVKLVHAKVIEEYEHLDVIWAIDSIEKVGKEVREVLWKTMPEDAREVCRRPLGIDKEV